MKHPLSQPCFISYFIIVVLATSDTEDKINLTVGDITDILKTYSDTIRRLTTVHLV